MELQDIYDKTGLRRGQLAYLLYSKTHYEKYREKCKEDMRNRYHSLTPEERRERNRRYYEAKMAKRRAMIHEEASA